MASSADLTPTLGPPSGPAHAAWKAEATAAILHATLGALLDRIVDGADRMQAELLGSEAAGVWWNPASESSCSMLEHERLIGRAYAAHLLEVESPAALAALRALQLGGGDGLVPEVAPAADRMAGRGVPEPSWWAAGQAVRTHRAASSAWDEDGHDYVTLLLEVERANERCTLVVVTTGDPEVIVDVNVLPALDGLVTLMREEGDEPEWSAPEEIQRRIRRAVDRTDLLGVATPYDRDRPEAGFVAFRGLALRWTDPSVRPAGE